MGAERFGWQVVGDIDGAVCTTDIEVLEWSDIVKSSMSDGIAATYAQMIRTAWIYISTGILFDIVKLRKGPVIAALYPVGFLVLQAAFALFCAYGAFQVLSPVVGVLPISRSS